MWKIGLGYVLLLIWCYLQAERTHRKRSLSADSASEPPARPTSGPLRGTAIAVLLAGAGMVVWGSGWNCLFWLPSGFLLAGLIQTLLPLRAAWR